MIHFGHTEAMIIIENEIWTIPVESNNLIAVNIETGETSLIMTLPGIGQKRLYSKIIRYNNTLFFIPLSAENILALNLHDYKLSNIKVNLPEREENLINYNSSLKFASALIVEDYLYVLGCTFPAIVRMSLETNEITYYTDWVEKVEKYRTNINDVYFRSYFKKDNKLYLPVCCGNMIVIFDLEDGNSEVQIIGEDTYSDVVVLDTGKYLSSKQSGKLLYIHSNKIEEIINLSSRPTINMYIEGERIIVITDLADESYRVNITSNKSEKLELKNNHILGSIRDDKYIYMIGSRFPELIKIPLDSNADIEYIKLRIKGELLFELLLKDIGGKNLYCSEEDLGLEQYIKLIQEYGG